MEGIRAMVDAPHICMGSQFFFLFLSEALGLNLCRSKIFSNWPFGIMWALSIY